MAEITRRRHGEFLTGIFQLLRTHPDGMAAKEVLTELPRLVPPTPFEAADYPNRPGVRRYEKTARFSTIGAVKAGWLVKDKGQWIATEEGLQALARYPDPEALIREADAAYRRWYKQRQPAPDPLDVDDPSGEAETTSTFEEAEEAAFSQIEAYINDMPPYGFQDLVAALLDAMGYFVMWTAPPGPDRGIDIIAGNDPLGISDPRIKVQVKRRSAAADVSDLRAFMAVLGARDVGMFVSTGGFTKDAEMEARTHETRKLTLINLNRLLTLWIENYNRIEESRRQLLPLKPVHYLAPDS